MLLSRAQRRTLPRRFIQSKLSKNETTGAQKEKAPVGANQPGLCSSFAGRFMKPFQHIDPEGLGHKIPVDGADGSGTIVECVYPHWVRTHFAHVGRRGRSREWLASAINLCSRKFHGAASIRIVNELSTKHPEGSTLQAQCACKQHKHLAGGPT